MRLGRAEQVQLAGRCRVIRGQKHRRAGHRRAAGDAIERGRHIDAHRGRRVVGDLPLRIPVAAAAVQKTWLCQDGRDVLLHRAALVPLGGDADRLAIGHLWRQAAGVRNRQRQHLVARLHGGQVDHQCVLVLDADAEEPAVLLADDRLHDERIGQVQRDGAQPVGLDLQPDLRPPFDPLAIGRHAHVDVVVEDVVVGEVVFVVEAAVARDLLRRCIERDVVAVLAVEERDVLGLRRRIARR